jgi:hypothetical protein
MYVQLKRSYTNDSIDVREFTHVYESMNVVEYNLLNLLSSDLSVLNFVTGHHGSICNYGS